MLPPLVAGGFFADEHGWRMWQWEAEGQALKADSLTGLSSSDPEVARPLVCALCRKNFASRRRAVLSGARHAFSLASAVFSGGHYLLFSASRAFLWVHRAYRSGGGVLSVGEQAVSGVDQVLARGHAVFPPGDTALPVMDQAFSPAGYALSCVGKSALSANEVFSWPKQRFFCAAVKFFRRLSLA